MQWSASPFDLSLLFVQGGQFVNQHFSLVLFFTELRYFFSIFADFSKDIKKFSSALYSIWFLRIAFLHFMVLAFFQCMAALDGPLILNWHTEELTRALCAQTGLTTAGHLYKDSGDLRGLKISVCVPLILFIYLLVFLISFCSPREVSWFVCCCCFCWESITLVATTPKWIGKGGWQSWGREVPREDTGGKEASAS